MPFIAPIIAAAAPLIASATAAWAAIGVIGQAVVMAGIGIASSYLLQKMMPTNAGDTSATGSSFEKQYGNTVSRQVLMGTVGLAGHDVYINTYPPTGNPNSQCQQVFVLSDYYTTSLERVWINGELATLSAPDPLFNNFMHVLSGPATGFVKIKYYDGRQTSADVNLIDPFADPDDRWTPEMIGFGVSYIVCDITYNKDDFNSFPDFFFEVQGAPLYDWRLDSTAGGTGPHRWDDVTTHEFSKNPIVMEYNFRRGLSVNDDPFCGMFMDAADLPLDKYTVAANICDELDVEDSLPRYECSIIVDCGSKTTHGQTIKAMNLSCGAMQIDGVQGAWPIVGSDQASVITFYDSDLVSSYDEFRYSAKQSMGSLVNSVYGQFISPDDQYSLIDYKEQTSDALVTIDRRTRDVGIDFPTVSNNRQAENLAAIYLAENRFEATASVMLRPRFQGVEVGDWIEWESELYGWTKTFLVTDRSLISLQSDKPRNVVLRLQERDGSIYDGITPSELPIIIPNALPEYLAEVESFNLTPVIVTGDSGRLAPAIRAAWAAIEDVTVNQVEILYYPTAQPSAAFSKVVDVNQIVVILNEGVVSNTEYTVQTRLITVPLRTTVFSSGDTVTTNDIAVTSADLDAALRYQVTTLQNQNKAEFDQFKALISSILADDQATNWLDKKKVRKQLSARSEAAFAEIAQVETVAVDAQTAVADLETSVTAEFGTVNANVTANTSAIATLDGYAAAQYSVTLDVNGYQTGFELINGGASVSTATFIVDNFRVARPASGAAGNPINVFNIGTINGVSKIGIKGDVLLDGSITASNAIISGTITGTLIQASTITTGKIAVGGVDILNLVAGAATAISFFSGSIPTATAGDLFSAPFTTAGSGNVVIFTQLWMSGGLAAGSPIAASIKVDGVTVDTQYYENMECTPGGGGATYCSTTWRNTSFTLVSGLSNASHTFSVSVGSIAHGGLAAAMVVINLRR